MRILKIRLKYQLIVESSIIHSIPSLENLIKNLELDMMASFDHARKMKIKGNILWEVIFTFHLSRAAVLFVDIFEQKEK